MAALRRPEIVVAADWSVNPSGQRIARAYLLDDGRYVVCPPEQVGDPATLLKSVAATLAPGATGLIGFDFPLGLPRKYAALVGLVSFRDGLRRFGRGRRWRHFFTPSDLPSPRQPFGPASSNKGCLSRGGLAERLTLTEDDLYRSCERTDGRRDAESLFFTLGAKQVGRAALSGWNLIRSARPNPRLWPFDGALEALLEKPGLVVAEIYPAEAYHHVGLDGMSWSKRRPDDRVRAGNRVLGRVNGEDIELTEGARQALRTGCASDNELDALLSVLSMVAVLQGRRPAPLPDDPVIHSTEGWILGQALSAKVSP